MEWSEMREMHRSGMSITEIAKNTGCDRKTVRKYIRAMVPPEYERRPMAEGQGILDPYKDYLKGRLAHHPLTAARLHREIRELGYAGSLTTVKRYIAPFKETQAVAEIRFETKPGEQGQVDWIDIGRVQIGNEFHPIYVFVMELGWSHMRFIHMTMDKKTDTFIECHLAAFEYFGGFPRTLLYDNLKSVVLELDPIAKRSKLNPKFRDFLEHYGIASRLCRPGLDGAGTKGKVERTIHYAERDFLLGSIFFDVPHANTLGLRWCDRVNGEVHGNTHEVPKERWPREGLTPIDHIVPYLLVRHKGCKASKDCFVRYQNNFYLNSAV